MPYFPFVNVDKKIYLGLMYSVYWFEFVIVFCCNVEEYTGIFAILEF